jgi:hypothetical protein
MIFKRSHSKYGKHIFTFPDGKKVYQLDEQYFEKLPSKKLLSIQENSNYIAFLGVSKTTLEAGHKMIKDKAYEAKAIIKDRDRTKLERIIDEQVKLIEQIETTRKEYDGTNEAILVSLFDLFFYFDDEDMFTWSEESMERKRHYLNSYPYFRSFFFQRLNAYMTAYKITLQNCIHFALAQSTIQEIVKDLNHISTNEAKTK